MARSRAVLRRPAGVSGGLSGFIDALRKTAWLRPVLFIAAIVMVVCILTLVVSAALAPMTIFVHDGSELAATLRQNKPDSDKAIVDAGILINDRDIVSPPIVDENGDAHIYISRAFTVSVVADGVTTDISTAGSTAGEILAEAGIILGEHDYIEPEIDIDGQITLPMTIYVRRVVSVTDSIETMMAYETTYQTTDTLYIDENKVSVVGEYGSRLMTFRQLKLINDDGSETVLESEPIDDVVLKEPIDEVVLLGAKERPKPPKQTTTAKPATPNTNAPSPGTTVSSKPDTSTPSKDKAAFAANDSGGYTVTINGVTYNSCTKLDVKAFAYSNTNKNPKTFSGTTPIPGKTIAVDPSYIPLGSVVYIVSLDGTSWSYGPAKAEDKGSAIKDNKIDLYMTSKTACTNFGVRNCILYILK